MTWKDGGKYGRLWREIVGEDRHIICTVMVKHFGDERNSTKPWPEGEANFRLILAVPETAKALRAIAEGAIVSPEQPPEKVAEQALRVLQSVREQNCELMLIVGAQQKRAEQMLEALEAIVKARPPRWPSLSEVLEAYNQHKEIARAAIAVAKGENDETELA